MSELRISIAKTYPKTNSFTCRLGLRDYWCIALRKLKNSVGLNLYAFAENQQDFSKNDVNKQSFDVFKDKDVSFFIIK